MTPPEGLAEVVPRPAWSLLVANRLGSYPVGLGTKDILLLPLGVRDLVVQKALAC